MVRKGDGKNICRTKGQRGEHGKSELGSQQPWPAHGRITPNGSRPREETCSHVSAGPWGLSQSATSSVQGSRGTGEGGTAFRAAGPSLHVH